MVQEEKLSVLYDSAEQVRSRGIADLRDYWQSRLRGRKMPHPDDIDLKEVAALLPGLIITEYVGASARVRYRLVGAIHAHYSASDFTGRYLDEMAWSEMPFVARVHETLRRTKAPVYGSYQWDFRDHLPGYSEFGFFPLSRDGQTVTDGIGFDDCSEFEQVLDRAR